VSKRSDPDPEPDPEGVFRIRLVLDPQHLVKCPLLTHKMLESDPVGLNPVLLHLCQELGGHDLVLVLNVYLDKHYRRFTFF
jgi:hypothetical protein